MYIKYLLVLFSFFVFFSQATYAKPNETDKNAIKVLIEKVKIVEPKQRRVLMNELKVMLRSMHQETRKQVMLDLRRSFSNNRGAQTRNRAKQSNIHHQTTMTMTESKHMQEHMMQSTMTDMKPPPGNTPHTPMRGM